MTASGGGSGPRHVWKEDPLRSSRGGGSGLGLVDVPGREVLADPAGVRERARRDAGWG